MKKYSGYIIGTAALFILANYSSDNTTVDGKQKNKINVDGVLQTYQTDEQGNNKEYTVDNIAIGRVFEGIPVYAMPSQTDLVMKENKIRFKKDINPVKKYAKTNIDLVTSGGKQETKEIRIDNPNKVYVYKKNQYSTPAEYVEIIVKSNDPAGTEEKYIIDIRQKLTCDELNEAGPKEMEVPIQAIKKLTITGYAHRDAPRDSYKSASRSGKAPEPVRDELDITSEILEDLPEKARGSGGR